MIITVFVSAINSMCQCLIVVFFVVFSQNIPCRARSAFLEHVSFAIADYKTFQFTLAQMTVPTREFIVDCTNTADETYFSGPAWTSLLNSMKWYLVRCNFFLDHGTKEVYFMYVHPECPRSDSDEGDI